MSLGVTHLVMPLPFIKKNKPEHQPIDAKGFSDIFHLIFFVTFFFVIFSLNLKIEILAFFGNFEDFDLFGDLRF